MCHGRTAKEQWFEGCRGVDQLGGPSLCASGGVSPAPSLAGIHPSLNCGEKTDRGRISVIYFPSRSACKTPDGGNEGRIGSDFHSGCGQCMTWSRGQGLTSAGSFLNTLRCSAHHYSFSAIPPPLLLLSECFMTQSFGLFRVAWHRDCLSLAWLHWCCSVVSLRFPSVPLTEPCSLIHIDSSLSRATDLRK